jgi:hypothetical protein
MFPFPVTSSSIPNFTFTPPFHPLSSNSSLTWSLNHPRPSPRSLRRINHTTAFNHPAQHLSFKAYHTQPPQHIIHRMSKPPARDGSWTNLSTTSDQGNRIARMAQQARLQTLASTSLIPCTLLTRWKNLPATASLQNGSPSEKTFFTSAIQY